MTIRYVARDNLATIEERYLDIVDGRTAVGDFLDLFGDPKFSGITVVLNSRDLHNGRNLGVKGTMPYLLLPAEHHVDRNAVVEACTHRGHLSVFFFPRSPQLLLEEFYGRGYYSHIDAEGRVDAAAQIPGIGAETADSLSLFLAENAELCLDVGCAFSHDADLFYELRFYVSGRDMQ